MLIFLVAISATGAGDLPLAAREQDEALIERAREEAKQGQRLALTLANSAATFAHFEAALDLYSQVANLLPNPQEIAAVALDFGASAVDYRQMTQALAALRLAALFDPDLRVDPMKHHPGVVKTFAAAKEDLARARRSSLLLSGSPSHAEVILDGRPQGALPLSLSQLSVGEHWLIVRATGFVPFASRVTLEENKPQQLQVHLKADAHLGSTVAQSERALISSRPSTIPPAKTAPPPTQSAMPLVHRGIPPALALLPFGIAQFLEHRPVAASLLLSSQLALITLNIASYVIATRQAAPLGGFYQPELVQTLKWTINISFFLIVADVIAGSVDGWLQRNQGTR
jgi:PEGA domain